MGRAGAKSKGNPSRSQRRAARRQERAAAAEAAKHARGRSRSGVLPAVFVTLLGAGALWYTQERGAYLGLWLLLGIGTSLGLWLRSLGSSVAPRDRNKAGNIDFGA